VLEKIRGVTATVYHALSPTSFLVGFSAQSDAVAVAAAADVLEWWQ